MGKKKEKIEFDIIELNAIQANPEQIRGKTLNLMWMLMYIVCIISICMVIITFLVQKCSIEGSSMSPTINASESVLVNKLSYIFSKPERYDTIVFTYDKANNINYAKRIIGLPGENIQIMDGKVYINGQKLNDDPFSDIKIDYAGVSEGSMTLGSDEYFVLGDNRNDSLDSRYSSVGVVHKNQIIGKIFLKMFPFEVVS